MDSNVSKYTDSHKFFKLGINQEKIGISVKNLLKQEVLSILAVDQQNFNVEFQHSFGQILDHKIVLSDVQNSHTLCRTKLKPIIYSCPLGLILAKDWQISPLEIIQELEDIWLTETKQNNSDVFFFVELSESGWINFHLDSEFIARWLEQCVFYAQHNCTFNSQVIPLDQSPGNLFQAQYLHARCCSLLLLGEREKLISLEEISPERSWQIAQPSLISWLNQDNCLHLAEPAEHNLICQLITVMDLYVVSSSSTDWSKIILQLTGVMTIFLSQCRFLGDIKEKERQKAIARLGIIALGQYWLAIILREKLKVAAPNSL